MDIFTLIRDNKLEEAEGLAIQSPEVLGERDTAGLRPLMVCLYYGKHDLAITLRNLMSEVTIWEAAALGELETVREWLGEEDNLKDRVSSDGFSSLGLTAFMGHQVVLEELLKKGADPNKPSQNQMVVYPINSAAAHLNSAVALEMVRKLIEHGAEVNVAQHGGWTPLHQAASNGDQTLVTLLLDSGADRTLNSEDGRSASQMALENGYDQLAEVLAP